MSEPKRGLLRVETCGTRLIGRLVATAVRCKCCALDHALLLDGYSHRGTKLRFFASDADEETSSTEPRPTVTSSQYT